MREDSLTAMRRKPFAPPTSDSRHGFLIVPNLLRGLVPSGPDQIWVADITYVRVRESFAYLAIILDGFSRKVVGWAIALYISMPRSPWKRSITPSPNESPSRVVSSIIPIAACSQDALTTPLLGRIKCTVTVAAREVYKIGDPCPDFVRDHRCCGFWFVRRTNRKALEPIHF